MSSVGWLEDLRKICVTNEPIMWSAVRERVRVGGKALVLRIADSEQIMCAKFEDI